MDLVPLCVYNCKLNPDTVAVHLNNIELAIFKTRTTFLNFFVYAAGANNVNVCNRLALCTDCALMLHSFWFPSGSGTNGFLRHLLQKQFVLLAVLDTQEFYVLVFTLQIIFFLAFKYHRRDFLTGDSTYRITRAVHSFWL